jgi:hypothetical protein
LQSENAQVVELVDTLDSKSNVARRAGSIPALSTLRNRNYFIYKVLRFFYLVI